MYLTTEMEAVDYSIAEKISEILEKLNLIKLEKNDSTGVIDDAMPVTQE